MAEPITTEMVAPELRDALAKLPRIPLRSALFRRLAPYLMRLRRTADMPGVMLSVHKSPALRVYRPSKVESTGALLWIHGGGYIIGAASIDDPLCAEIASTLGIVVVSAEYRLAPRHPFPVPLDDCHAAWRWLLASAETLGVDPARVAIGGMSAGGGLAAALVQRVCDEEGANAAAQLLMAPMLDDRTAADRKLDVLAHPVWDNELNRLGWRSYLGAEPGAARLPPYAAPARREDLTTLPPAWIGVGAIELFHDEDLEYARRLEASHVPVTLEIVPGAPHGFEAWGKQTHIGKRHIAKAIAWLGDRVG